MNQQDFLTIEEAARGLGKSAQTIRRMIKRGELSFKQVKTPQGFQYVIDRAEVFSKTAVEVAIEAKIEPEADLQMFSNSPIQNPIEPLCIEQKPILTNQSPILTSQNDLEPLIDNDYYTLDRNPAPPPLPGPSALMKIIELQHKEKMMLIHILENLQEELRREHESRSILENIWRRLFG